jgi:hypothetical protein
VGGESIRSTILPVELAKAMHMILIPISYVIFGVTTPVELTLPMIHVILEVTEVVGAIGVESELTFPTLFPLLEVSHISVVRGSLLTLSIILVISPIPKIAQSCSTIKVPIPIQSILLPCTL